MSVVKIKARTYRISPAPVDKTEVGNVSLPLVSARSTMSESPAKRIKPHSKNLSMISEFLSPQRRFHHHIQTLTDTLMFLSKHRNREVMETANKQVPEEADVLHERILAALTVDSMLKVEVDLVHSKRDIEAAISETARGNRVPESGGLFPKLSASPIPFAKQVPSSVYDSYKNLSSFDRLTTKQEIESMISQVSHILLPKDPARCQKVEKELTTAYERSFQSESRLCSQIWYDCLLAFSSIGNTRKPYLDSIGESDSDLVSVQKELETVVNSFIQPSRKPKTEEEIIDGVSKLSQQFRILIKKLPGEHLIHVAELFWKCAVILYDQLQVACKAVIAQGFEEVKMQVQKEESRINAHLRLCTQEWETRLQEATAENEQLRDHLSRLRHEIEHCMEVVSDRDEELRQLRDSGMYSELEKILSEFVANAGDDPGEPVLPKSLLGSVSGTDVKLTPTRFGQGKPEPMLVKVWKEDTVVEERKIVLEEPKTPEQPESDSEVSVSEETLTYLRQKTGIPGSNRESIRESGALLKANNTIQNIILYQLNRHPHSAAVLKPKDVYKLFESVMDAKFKSDLYDEEQGNNPRSLTEFTLDFLYLVNEKRTLTLKHLASLVKSLEKMRSDGDPYATMFGNLLELPIDSSCPEDLSLFIVKARRAFQEVLGKGKIKISKTDVEVGGKITLSDAADLIYDVFLEEREVGEQVLARLNLPDVNEIQKAQLIFCGKLAKIGRDLKHFYVQADVQKVGSIGFPLFSKTCRNTLEMNLSIAHVQALWSSLTSADVLTYLQLTNLDFKGLSAKAHSKALTISKVEMLNCIVEQYRFMRKADLESLQNIFLKFDADGDGVMTLKEFASLIESLEEGYPPSLTVQMFREALELDDNISNPDAMSPEAFCRVALRHQLGGFGKDVFQSKLSHLFTKQEDDSVAKSEKANKKKKGKKK